MIERLNPNSLDLMKNSHSNRSISVAKHNLQNFPCPDWMYNVRDFNSHRSTRPSTSCWDYEVRHSSRFCRFNVHKCAKRGVTVPSEGFLKRRKSSSCYRVPTRINYIHVLSKSNPQCFHKYLFINVDDHINTL